MSNLYTNKIFRLAEEVRIAKHQKLMERKRLEQTWDASIDEKQKRLLHAMQCSREPGILVLQQCDKYKRYNNIILVYLHVAIQMTCYIIII